MGESGCCSQLHRPGRSERDQTPNLNVLSSLLNTRRGEIKRTRRLHWLPHPRAVPAKGTAPGARSGLPPEARARAQYARLHHVQGAPALPSQLRFHLEEIAQSIPVGTFNPVIQDEAPSPQGHTGGDRRAGQGGARAKNCFL